MLPQILAGGERGGRVLLPTAPQRGITINGGMPMPGAGRARRFARAVGVVRPSFSSRAHSVCLSFFMIKLAQIASKR